MMKKIFIPIVTVALLGLVPGWAFSAEAIYKIRADGLACPYCAYGIEKKFMKVKNVKHVDIDLKAGMVVVTGDEKLKFTKPQLKILFNDAGFTFRKIASREIREQKPVK